MRLALAVLLATTATVAADPKPVALSVSNVSALLAPISEDIEHCYIERTAEVRGAGQLQLVLTVTRRGTLESLAVKTPGIATKLAKQIDGCIRPLVETVAFPARKTFTTATIPYFFQHTAAPGSGPQLSCWDPAGCKTK